MASLEEKIDPGQLESDKDRLLLIQEKEQLLRELRSISPRNRSLQEMERVKAQCESLEQDLNNALETSNRCIADRLQVHETKQKLLQQLTEAMRTMTQLESQLKLLSASTLSMSSSSSLGSLSSSHASSKGSLSSLSFTDIYGLSTANAPELVASDLSKKFLQPQPQMSSSQQSLSSHSSLSSLSPPVTPMESGYPPSYGRGSQQPLRLSTIDESSQNPGKSLDLQDFCSDALLSPTSSGTPGGLHRVAVSSESVAGDSGVFEAATSPTKHGNGSDADKLTSLMAAMSFEAAQVQIKMRYDRQDSLLHICLEKVRNLRTLVLKPNRQLYLKVSLVPSVSPTNWSFTTKPISLDSSSVQINDHFPVAVPKAKLSTKTLQITVWMQTELETCVGSAQISLADYDWEVVSCRWYNLLGLQFSVQPPKVLSVTSLHNYDSVDTRMTSLSTSSSQQGTLKEESSDDSTIISSQASTLTRNLNPADGLRVFQDYYEDDLNCSSDDIVIPSEPCKAFDLELLRNQVNKETNTEYVQFFNVPSSGGARPKVKDVVKRSKTFSPKDAQDKYCTSVKLNRSDSDGAMPLYRKLPFQHKMMERRSLRLPTKFNLNRNLPSNEGVNVKAQEKVQDQTKLQLKRSRRLARTKEHMMETPLDLELDLAAQRTKLDLLQSDIARLKEIQDKLEEAKAQGGKHQECWLQDHEYLETLLSKVNSVKEFDSARFLEFVASNK